MIKIFTETTQVTQACLKELLKVYTKGKITDESIKEKNTAVINKYAEFHTYLDDAAFKNNKFIDFLHIYVSCIASAGGHKVNFATLNMCNKTVEVLEAYTRFAEINHSSIEFDDAKNLTKTHLSEDLISFLTWSLSKVCHSLVKNYPEGKNENLDKLMTSKLFSGGIETKYISTFSEKAQKEIKLLQSYLRT